MMYQTLDKYPDPNAHIDCDCGFSGSIRFYEAPVGVVGRCFGCDLVYIRGIKEDGTETINLSPKSRAERDKPKPMAEIPEFRNMDEAMAFAAKLRAGKTKGDTTGKKRTSRKRKPAEKDQSTELIQTKPNA